VKRVPVNISLITPSYDISRRVLSHIIVPLPLTLPTGRAHANRSDAYRFGRVTAVSSKQSEVTAGTAENAHQLHRAALLVICPDHEPSLVRSKPDF